MSAVIHLQGKGMAIMAEILRRGLSQGPRQRKRGMPILSVDSKSCMHVTAIFRPQVLPLCIFSCLQSSLNSELTPGNFPFAGFRLKHKHQLTASEVQCFSSVDEVREMGKDYCGTDVC